MEPNHRGFVTEAILLSIGRAIVRKQQRDNHPISDYEAKGHAMVIQGRYRFVEEQHQELFCEEVVRAFRYVAQRQLASVNKAAYLRFQMDEVTGNSILDSELIEDLKGAGY
ncbi:hypothetical protein DF039_31950 [Burkholderia cenocepacia]|nr:hypothetical protein DF039_31950 [Burkholderia cenocepacia]